MTTPIIPVTPTISAAADTEKAAVKRTLLIVDDEEGIRNALKHVFRLDYNVLTAEGGRQALELAIQNPIDSAVLDIAMVDMSGIDLLARLKKMDPTIEGVMCTAYETIETAQQALRLGACDYLTKPYDVPAMRAAVAKAMERHAIAGEIRQTNHTLENLKAEIGSLSSQMELMRMQGEIYASIIHDINSPLTAIVGYANLISDRIAAVSCLEGQDLSRVKSHMAVVTHQLMNCGEISRRYLRFLQEQRPDCSSASVNQILADLGHLLIVHPSARNHRLVIDPSPAEVEARVNGAELMQVLLNLAINGFQCTPQEHEVKIRGETLRQPLDLSRFTDGAYEGLVNRQGFHNTPPLAALSVQDTGPGIPPEVLPKIFDSFFTTKPKGTGTGLGLSIVRRIVTDAHGAIYFHSQPGSGSQFTLFLPAWEKVDSSSPRK